MLNEKKLLENKFKRIWYLNIIFFLPLLFLNQDMILSLDIFKKYADYIGNIFAHIEQISLYSKSIGEEYYTIKFIYSYSFIIAIIVFLYTFHVCSNLYLYNLNIIKNTKYNFEIISIKETGSWFHPIMLIFYIIILFGFIFYWMDNSSITNHVGRFTVEVFTYKYFAIFISCINSMIFGNLFALISIDILAKIYSRNFRILEPLGKNKKKVFSDIKKAIFSKRSLYSILLLSIVLFIYGISELIK